MAGVVEVVVADARLGGIDDLWEEGGQAGDAGGHAERELLRVCEWHSGIRWRLERSRLLVATVCLVLGGIAVLGVAASRD